jgi:hypothetical protein
MARDSKSQYEASEEPKGWTTAVDFETEDPGLENSLAADASDMKRLGKRQEYKVLIRDRSGICKQ